MLRYGLAFVMPGKNTEFDKYCAYYLQWTETFVLRKGRVVKTSTWKCWQSVDVNNCLDSWEVGEWKKWAWCAFSKCGHQLKSEKAGFVQPQVLSSRPQLSLYPHMLMYRGNRNQLTLERKVVKNWRGSSRSFNAGWGWRGMEMAAGEKSSFFYLWTEYLCCSLLLVWMPSCNTTAVFVEKHSLFWFFPGWSLPCHWPTSAPHPLSKCAMWWDQFMCITLLS